MLIYKIIAFKDPQTTLDTLTRTKRKADTQLSSKAKRSYNNIPTLKEMLRNANPDVFRQGLDTLPKAFIAQIQEGLRNSQKDNFWLF